MEHLCINPMETPLAYSSISSGFPWDAGEIDAAGGKRARTSQKHDKDLKAPEHCDNWCSGWEHILKLTASRPHELGIYNCTDIWIGQLTNYSTAVRIDWYVYARASYSISIPIPGYDIYYAYLYYDLNSPTVRLDDLPHRL